MNRIFGLISVKESWKTGTIAVWGVFALRIILFVYEIDLDPNENIIDWINFSVAALVFLVPFTIVYLIIVKLLSELIN